VSGALARGTPNARLTNSRIKRIIVQVCDRNRIARATICRQAAERIANGIVPKQKGGSA